MNYKMMGRFLSQVLTIEGVFMIPALTISLFARETGAGVYQLDMAMSGSSYFDAMYHNLDTIKEALQ